MTSGPVRFPPFPIRGVRVRHQKQNCAPHFAEIEVDFEPAAEGFVFEVARELSVEPPSAGDLSRFVTAAARGIEEQLTSPDHGYRVVVATRVVLRHVRAHASDSHELAFRIAGYLAARKALERAGGHGSAAGLSPTP
ncbi:Elongation factor G, domain IV [Streptomyces sp. DI166]|nr:Elongation factor G, domain IV [Streptomyces sp. DI166]